jgi:hypothetical protein
MLLLNICVYPTFFLRSSKTLFFSLGNLGGVVGVVAKLQGGWSGVRIPVGTRDLFLL